MFDDPDGGLRDAPSRTERRRSREPHEQPWGQMVAYVRDPFGTLVELATPTD